MIMKIETFAILAFVIAIASVLYVGMAFGSSSNSELEKQETEDEKIHEEWAKENYNYQFVRCPNDTNTYPEGTKCSSDEEEED